MTDEKKKVEPSEGGGLYCSVCGQREFETFEEKVIVPLFEGIIEVVVEGHKTVCKNCGKTHYWIDLEDGYPEPKGAGG